MITKVAAAAVATAAITAPHTNEQREQENDVKQQVAAAAVATAAITAPHANEQREQKMM